MIKKASAFLLVFALLLTFSACDAGGAAHWGEETGNFNGIPQYTGAGEVGDFNDSDDGTSTAVTINGVGEEDYQAYIDLLAAEGFEPGQHSGDSTLYIRGDIKLLVAYNGETLILVTGDLPG